MAATGPQNLPTDATLRRAIVQHKAGKLQQAEQLYRAVLQALPFHADANHNLGLLLTQTGKQRAALPYLKTALAVDPTKAQYSLSYAEVLLATGSAKEALDIVRNSIQRGGTSPKALALRQSAEAAIQDMPQREGRQPGEPTRSELGALVGLFRDGHYLEVENRTRALLKLNSDSGLAWKLLGACLLVQGKDALAALQRAAELLPDDAEASNNLGLALKTLGQVAAALESFRRAVELKPDYAEAHCNLGAALREFGELENAATSFSRALDIQPDFPAASINLGSTLHLIAGKNSGRVFFSARSHDFQGVRRQYESLPFPARNPDAEHYMLWISVPDILGKLNQYCFGGGRDFSKPFRVLVAGCGTGDSAIWLGHQLQGTPAEIVAIDISAASLEIAQARARVRKLNNINWVNASLLDIAALGLGRFDYITSLGVLHHLGDPVQGLKALESVLAEGGAMALMVYGAVGRAHIYAMQKTLRQLAAGLDAPGERLAFARRVIANLPASNGFRKHEGTALIQSQYLQDDTNLWDTLLHEQDRAYTASEVRDFLGSAGLMLQSFVSYQGLGAVSSLQYELDLYIDDEQQRARLRHLPLAERQDIAEVLDGGLALHTVYATRVAQALNPTAADAILAPMCCSGRQILAHVSASDQGLPVILGNGMVINYQPSVVTRAFLAQIDGQRSNSDIACLLGIRADSSDMALVARELGVPTALHWLIGRTRAGSRLPPLPDPGGFTLPLRHQEPTSLAC